MTLSRNWIWMGITLGIFILSILHVLLGEIFVSSSDFYTFLFDFDPDKIEHVILKEFRIPRLFMCFIAGSSLSLAGLMMQTLFQNPLAGPYVLGINSGSSLLVALSVLSGWTFVRNDFGLIFSALIGAGIFAVLILFLANFLRNSLSLLLVGIMIGSFTGALVSILQSVSEANSLKLFTLWSMGSLQNVQFGQLGVIFLFYLLALLVTMYYSKSLNALILGEKEASLLGINVRKSRIGIICATVLFTGLVTAFCGPIAFIGLAVPNLIRILFKTQNHRILIPACLLGGVVFLLICDICVELLSFITPLPINAITSIIGAPMVIYFIIKRLA
ncbi:MAG: iron ABC transporter permease [Bacteroidetes bacterium]|nr:iron ABC transporter permease [Bacteroidota bacterium]